MNSMVELSKVQIRPERSAVFFDRDGTLVHDDGYTYRIEDLAWLPGAVEAIVQAKSQGHLVIVVTNQSGIARGYYTEAQMHAFHRAMADELALHGTGIDAFYFCPHHGDGTVEAYALADHPDRKPNPGMLRQAVVDWGIAPEAAVMVGDSAADMGAAKAFGIPALCVAPGELMQALERALPKGVPQTGDGLTLALGMRAEAARDWLFSNLLPFWWEHGFDRDAGLFHEQINPDGTPVPMARRIRVQARQTVVYGLAGRLGWHGPWREAVTAGLDALLTQGLRADGGTRHKVDPSGASDDRRDLYDSAFVIFGLAEGARALGGQDDLAERALQAAHDLVDWLHTHWVHPAGGFIEGDLARSDLRAQNPHMHLLEALLALYEVSGAAKPLDAATGLVDLIVSAIGDAAGGPGVVAEFYTNSFKPILDGDDGVIEPGHQFEWSFLLDWYQRLSGRDLGGLDLQLYRQGEVRGVAPRSGLIHETVNRHGQPITDTSRIWTHCERLKAALIRVERDGDPAAARAACQSVDRIMEYYREPTMALAYERCTPDGSFIEQAARASTPYHVVFAISELLRVTGR